MDPPCHGHKKQQNIMAVKYYKKPKSTAEKILEALERKGILTRAEVKQIKKKNHAPI